jgi:hypothetical protein
VNVNPNFRTVEQYLTHHLRICGKTREEVARACGYPNASCISMIKSGAMNLPLEKVPALGGALGRDPLELARLAIAQYLPQVSGVIEGEFERLRFNARRERVSILDAKFLPPQTW